MVMKSGEQWRCTNPACRCEVVVQSTSEVAGSNPRCVCGFPMKKTYSRPRFRYLDFLHIEDSALARGTSQKD